MGTDALENDFKQQEKRDSIHVFDCTLLLCFFFYFQLFLVQLFFISLEIKLKLRITTHLDIK